MHSRADGVELGTADGLGQNCLPESFGLAKLRGRERWLGARGKSSVSELELVAADSFRAGEVAEWPNAAVC